MARDVGVRLIYVGPMADVGGRLAVVCFDHLRVLTDGRGMLEHARHDRPRSTLGYTVDDNARGLVVLSRLAPPDEVADLIEAYARFVVSARRPSGWHNRMAPGGVFVDRPRWGDAAGRALWGLGCLARAEPGALPPAAHDVFAGPLPFPAEQWHPAAFAVLGLVEAVASEWVSASLMASVARLADSLPVGGRGPWRWPEPRLRYANARLPEALIAAGATIEDPRMVSAGLSLLEWLVEVESGERGFSFTPVGGRGPDERGPAFDQQPIEAFAMVDACLRAYRATGEDDWLTLAGRAGRWFLGDNDVGVSLYDPATGAGFDGLEAAGVNRNRGAESTLSVLGSLLALGAAVERR